MNRANIWRSRSHLLVDPSRHGPGQAWLCGLPSAHSLVAHGRQAGASCHGPALGHRRTAMPGRHYQSKIVKCLLGPVVCLIGPEVGPQHKPYSVQRGPGQAYQSKIVMCLLGLNLGLNIGLIGPNVGLNLNGPCWSGLRMRLAAPFWALMVLMLGLNLGHVGPRFGLSWLFIVSEVGL